MKQIHVTVTQQDIDNGRAKSCFHCPLAMAVNRHLPPGYVARVRQKDLVVLETTAPWYRSLANANLCDTAFAFVKSVDVYHCPTPQTVAIEITRDPLGLFKENSR